MSREDSNEKEIWDIIRRRSDTTFDGCVQELYKIYQLCQDKVTGTELEEMLSLQRKRKNWK